MRQGQQNRRGRGRNRKSQNPLTRSFESTGPDVKLRGTPSHIAEKYMSLARDALSSGDPVLAENYMQHAEHYNRIIMSFREQQLSQGGDPFAGGQIARGPGMPGDPLDDDEFSDGEVEEFGGSAQGGQPDMGAMPQPAPMPQQRNFDQPQRYDNRDNRQQHHRRDHQRHNNHQRHDRGDNRYDRHDRGDRGDRQFDRPDRQDRGDRPDFRSDRPHRGDRQDFRGDRDRGGDRPDRSFDRPERRERDFDANNGNSAHASEPRPAREAPAREVQPPPMPEFNAAPPPVEAAPAAAPAPASAPRRRERFQANADAQGAAAHQPDFLRRPVRRARPEPAAEEAPAPAPRSDSDE